MHAAVPGRPCQWLGERVDNAAMLAQLSIDGAALLAAAVDLDAAVPTCCGWTVRDAVAHTATVYAHKSTIIEGSLDAPPSDWPPEFSYDDVRDFFDEQRHRLLEALRTRAPETSVWTWYEPEQTVGFWVRRMMQETVIHRADVESAQARRPDIPDEVAVDGIDELIERMLCENDPDYYGGYSPGRGQRVVVTSAGHTWTITLGESVASFVRAAASEPDATVSGDASEVLLALWNRLPYEAVDATGDETALEALRALVAVATQ
jgi:uncharacterized protein (TIGR03083 family)